MVSVLCLAKRLRRLVGASVKGDGRVRALQADAGDAAAGDLVGGKGTAVFVGEVEETVSLRGLFQPVDEVLARSGLASATRSSRRG